ncbi:MAG: sugar phosphate isomerase/epimerase family protein [Promethearchaeota archaeon]
MKFAIVSGLNESNSSHPQILERFTNLCEFLSPLGYEGIELAILEPENIPVQKLKEIADSYQLKIPALGTGSTFLRFRYSLGALEAGIRKKAIERIKKYIDFSTISESKVIIGLIRGRRTFKNNPSHEAQNIQNSLIICSQLAEEHNVELLLEPINRFEIDSCNTIEETLELIESIGSSHLKLLVDTFHTHLEETPDSIWSYLEFISNKVSHLHLADDTRRAPGSGHFDFKRFLNIFQKAKFLGFASVETIMKPSFEVVARDSMAYLKSIEVF